MRIFTKNERDYLIELVCRNTKSSITNGEINNKNGLNKPMDAKERVRRTRIINKSMNGIHDLVLAELSGIIPSKKNIESGQPSLEKLFERHMVILTYIMNDLKEKSKPFLSDYNYKKHSELMKPYDSHENDDA